MSEKKDTACYSDDEYDSQDDADFIPPDDELSEPITSEGEDDEESETDTAEREGELPSQQHQSPDLDNSLASQIKTFQQDAEREAAYLADWKFNDPTMCCICLDEDGADDNPFVFCDGLDCEVITHRECYGISKIPLPDEPWYCDRCTAKPHEVVRCLLCPSRTGAFRRVSYDGCGKFVHVICAYWMPLAEIRDVVNMSDISIARVPARNWNMTCYLCPNLEESSCGACLQCDAYGCKRTFHVTCAQRFDLLETEENTEISNPMFVYCKEHCTQVGEPRMNRWERWVQKRDRWMVANKARERIPNDRWIDPRKIMEDALYHVRQNEEDVIAFKQWEVARLEAESQQATSGIDKLQSQISETAEKQRKTEEETTILELRVDRLLQALRFLGSQIELGRGTPEPPFTAEGAIQFWKDLAAAETGTRFRGNPPCWKPETAAIAVDLALNFPRSVRPPAKEISDNNSLAHSTKRKAVDGDNPSLVKRMKNITGKQKSATRTQVRSQRTSNSPETSKDSAMVDSIPLTKTESTEFASAKNLLPEKGTFQIQTSSRNPVSPGQIPITKPTEDPTMPTSIEHCCACGRADTPETGTSMETRRSSTPSISRRSFVHCTSCGKKYHLQCVIPPLKRAVPRGFDWICEGCAEGGGSDATVQEDL